MVCSRRKLQTGAGADRINETTGAASRTTGDNSGNINNGGSYFMERGQNAPEVATRRRGGLIDVPDQINTSVGLEGDTMRTLYGGGVIAIVCCLIIALGRVFAAQINANAITDDPDHAHNQPSRREGE